MAEHSDLPWRVFTTEDGLKLVGIGKEDGEGVLDAGFGVWAWDDPQGVANAKLVVRAVNAHDKLVAALMDVRARAQFELDHPTDMRDTAFSLIVKSADAVLANLKE